jgi:ATP-dependent Zn protease
MLSGGLFIAEKPGTWTIYANDSSVSGEATVIVLAIPDHLPPSILSTIPINGSTDVGVNSQILITFSEAMLRNATEDAISISTGTINKMDWTNNDKIIILTTTLEPGTTYVVKISTRAKDLAGNTMLKDYVFSFTTKQEGISNTTISFSLLILSVVILLFIALFLMRRRMKKLMAKEVASKKDRSVSSLSEKQKKLRKVYHASSASKVHTRKQLRKS